MTPDYSKYKKTTVEFKRTVDGRFIAKDLSGKVLFPDKTDTLIQTTGVYDVVLLREFEKFYFVVGVKRY